MGGMGMHGMGMGGTNLAALRQAPDFDRAFIEQMIPHHQMGVMMASMAQTNSQHPQLRQLQQAMVRAQQQSKTAETFASLVHLNDPRVQQSKNLITQLVFGESNPELTAQRLIETLQRQP